MKDSILEAALHAMCVQTRTAADLRCSRLLTDRKNHNGEGVRAENHNENRVSPTCLLIT